MRQERSKGHKLFLFHDLITILIQVWVGIFLEGLIGQRQAIRRAGSEPRHKRSRPSVHGLDGRLEISAREHAKKAPRALILAGQANAVAPKYANCVRAD